MDAIVAMNPCVDAETQVDKDVTWAEFTDYSQFVNKYRITNFVFLAGMELQNVIDDVMLQRSITAEL